MLRHYPGTDAIPDPSPITEPLFKISVCYLGEDIGTAILQPLRDALGKEATVLHSAKGWVDIMASGVDKGFGLHRLGTLVGAVKEEIMAFGDFYNDIPLLDAAGHPFIMPNAPQDLLERYPHADADWMHGGVTRTVRRLLLGDSGSKC
jgi:hydroxymethylpyrimidine pyrophosphatase-like HAD family hydrolase